MRPQEIAAYLPSEARRSSFNYRRKPPRQKRFEKYEKIGNGRKKPGMSGSAARDGKLVRTFVMREPSHFAALARGEPACTELVAVVESVDLRRRAIGSSREESGGPHLERPEEISLCKCCDRGVAHPLYDHTEDECGEIGIDGLTRRRIEAMLEYACAYFLECL